MGMLEAIVGAVAEALKKGIGRKNLVAITGMVLLSQMAEAPLWLCLMLVGVTLAAIGTQWNLDRTEITWTGKDQPDNGTGLDEVVTILGDSTPAPVVPPAA